jgi:cyclic beta-1,2-glucan synthetase
MGGSYAYIFMLVINSNEYIKNLDVRNHFQEDFDQYTMDLEDSFRSELFSSEKMNQHGSILAKSHKRMDKNSSDRMLERLDNNEKILLEVRKLLVDNIRSEKAITPSAEWLLDNFYLVEEQVVIARKHLPKGYSEGLPYLVNGSSSGMPRVYDIVSEMIAHSDGRIDISSLENFITSYQKFSLLSLGELWAVPIMLRLSVLENLRRVSVRIALEMLDHNLADYWSERIIETVRNESENLILTIGDLARSKPLLTNSFVSQFVKHLNGKGATIALALNWMEQQLSRNGLASNQLVQQDNQKQAGDQVSVSNSIKTLRLLGATDWRDFVEKLSDVERILREDQSGIYPLMDFATRDKYRHAIEEISKDSFHTESEVAEIAMSFVQNNKDPKEIETCEQETGKENHVGYYLIDRGKKKTEALAKISKSFYKEISNLSRRFSLFVYLSSILLLTSSIVFAMVQIYYKEGTSNWLLLILVTTISLSSVAQLSISVINWLYTLLVKPTILPRMDFSKKIPSEYRTLVIVPTIISNINSIDDLVNSLEIRYLSNCEDNIHYGLLTDFKDSKNETDVDDKLLIDHTINRIKSLNNKYNHSNQDKFFLFHRNRKWNQMDKKWMGYERKRGKLSDLNAFILRKNKTPFSYISENSEILHTVKYIISLDSDTKLPRESAWKFIATMAHPLNQPIYDSVKRRVVEGYTILQPRVGPSIPKISSLYLKISSSISGIDPYSRASSDVYQDLFNEGSFIGKGIYDVEMFERSLGGIFKDNRILSHDLIEGCYARSGYLSDVLLYEEDPSQYLADIKRRKRWIRGDWQLISWLMPIIKENNGTYSWNYLSILSKWKILDNLRRSLLPFSLLSFILLGWTILPYPWFWTLSSSVIVLFSVVAATGWQIFHKPDDLSLFRHLNEIRISIRDLFIRFLFGLTVLPFEAYIFTSTIFLTWWRMLVSKKNLLEWDASNSYSDVNSTSLIDYYRIMWFSPLLSLSLFFYLSNNNHLTLLIATPFLILWFFSPNIIYILSKPIPEFPILINEHEILFLRKISRKIWLFFEEFVTEDDHNLPPDNYQEHPSNAIAHRTSPTNLGLALLANLTAYDFGYISINKIIHRTSKALSSMNQLERFNGHFYNWYDTLTLTALMPKYISTVDSGNLIGHLLTLKQALILISNDPIFNFRIWQGLSTTCSIVEEEEDDNTLTKSFCLEYKEVLNKAMLNYENSLINILKIINELQEIQTLWIKKNQEASISNSKWLNILIKQLDHIRHDLINIVPWIHFLPVPEAFEDFKFLDQIPSFHDIKLWKEKIQIKIKNIQLEESKIENEEDKENFNLKFNNEGNIKWLFHLESLLTKSKKYIDRKILLIEQSVNLCNNFCKVEYGFIYNNTTHLLSIGYNVEDQRRDNSSYDLLASEARLAVYVGIAQGALPQESWFNLGRLLTDSGGEPTLLSWSGSMFEYLMPQLVMPSFANTLLAQTCRSTINRQIQYAQRHKVPWGISESGYNMVDSNLNYQYKAFGIPGLGLKRGLEKELVIAPYASLLALMINPKEACKNLESLFKKGFASDYGFYEAIDYTRSRLTPRVEYSIVQSHMIHHQGMGLLSISYILLNQPMQKRFLSDPSLQATTLLLQEKIPRATVFYAHTADTLETTSRDSTTKLRSFNTPHTRIPEIQLLSNGSYQVMISNSGGGYSRWKGLTLTRWREDITKDNYGIFCYIKDVKSGNFWSNTYQPTLHETNKYFANFSQGHVSFMREDFGLETRTEIVISPEDDVEMRRIKLYNKTARTRILDLTSYAEIVMASQASDESHPAFSNLFVQTEIVPEQSAILSTRRSRSESENPSYMFHLMNVYGVEFNSISYETDRMEFIGRERSLANPIANEMQLLSGKEGSVLDPIFSIRYRIIIKPFETATIDLIYGIAETKENCYNLMHKYQDKHIKSRAFELSWTHSQVLLRQINVSEIDAQSFDMLAGSIIYANSHMRSESSLIQKNLKNQSDLWSHSISGDLPILLLHVYNSEHLDFVYKIIKAHAYWRLKGLYVDLVIWNEEHGSYRNELLDLISGMISKELGIHADAKLGNIFIKSADQLSHDDHILFKTVARVILHDNKGTIEDQLNSISIEEPVSVFKILKSVSLESSLLKIELPNDLQFFNGRGGFTQDGKEYKIITSHQETTPAPWVNVIANPEFGTVVSESGSAYTWAINAHEYRLTPWNNDPVSDIGGEAFYLRDEETGHFWSPSQFPVRGENPYITTHGFGYSKWEHYERNIFSEMTVFIDKSLPIKFIHFKIKNKTGKEKKISLTGYLELILGDIRSKTNMHILTEIDSNTGSLLFRNRYNDEFSERVGFFKIIGKMSSFTCDRNEFIGRNRNLFNPQAMHLKRLSGKCGAALDSCAALQLKIDLIDGEEREVVFILGSGSDIQATQSLLSQFVTYLDIENAFNEVKKYWEDTLSPIQITTPDPATNILMNGWLGYQTISCRLYARSGFYQSGGAFGFRDQLQDVLAGMILDPNLARTQILNSSSRQFIEGDVQHWWHPPVGRGVRTRCSDDLLWLPYVVSEYIKMTGDYSILDEKTSYLESRKLFEKEDSNYSLPMSSDRIGTIYEHCVIAIKHSLIFGKHGLPLIGSGDWNDGMDQVGKNGKGESVWLGFFLFDVLNKFKPLAENKNDLEFVKECEDEANALQLNVESSSWDGEWYMRAFFDDGTPLGSKDNQVCQIDAIAQSWSILSGLGNEDRIISAMESLNTHLVKRDINIIKLLDPPFDNTDLNPGYIKGYIPGVRENGGQYTHAAIWALLAYAKLQNREKVWELFSMISPINHSLDYEQMNIYKVEPYVMAADVYASISHEGRGGWTWYTGAAGWMYSFLLGSFVGMKLEKDLLIFNPCYPTFWETVKIKYKYLTSNYAIEIVQKKEDEEPHWRIDMSVGKGNSFQLIDDGKNHQVWIVA